MTQTIRQFSSLPGTTRHVNAWSAEFPNSAVPGELRNSVIAKVWEGTCSSVSFADHWNYLIGTGEYKLSTAVLHSFQSL